MTENASDQRLVRWIAWFCGELSVLKNQRKATDYEYEREACDEGRWYPRDYHHVRTLRGLLERLG